MIFKSYEINKINPNINHLILFYGKNEGLKNEALNILIKNKKNISSYEEKEILDNETIFIENILSKSLFEKEKTVVIKRATDKILKIIEILHSKDLEDTKIIFLIKPTNKEINITEEEIISSMDDKFEETRKERATKQNFAKTISNKLISELVIN